MKLMLGKKVAADMNLLVKTAKKLTPEMVVQAKEKCSCEEKDGKCSCDGKCSDCECAQKKKAAIERVFSLLSKVSEQLDQAGLEKSAAKSLAVLENLVKEAGKKVPSLFDHSHMDEDEIGGFDDFYFEDESNLDEVDDLDDRREKVLRDFIDKDYDAIEDLDELEKLDLDEDGLLEEDELEEDESESCDHPIKNAGIFDDSNLFGELDFDSDEYDLNFQERPDTFDKKRKGKSRLTFNATTGVPKGIGGVVERKPNLSQKEMLKILRELKQEDVKVNPLDDSEEFESLFDDEDSQDVSDKLMEEARNFGYQTLTDPKIRRKYRALKYNDLLPLEEESEEEFYDFNNDFIDSSFEEMSPDRLEDETVRPTRNLPGEDTALFLEKNPGINTEIGFEDPKKLVTDENFEFPKDSLRGPTEKLEEEIKAANRSLDRYLKVLAEKKSIDEEDEEEDFEDEE